MCDLIYKILGDVVCTFGHMTCVMQLVPAIGQKTSSLTHSQVLNTKIHFHTLGH